MSAMPHNHSFAQKFAYPCTLIQAGVAGFRNAELANDRSSEFASATRGALQAAAVAGGIGLLASCLGRNPKRAVRNAFVLGAIGFCTEFCWRSRRVAPRMLAAVRKQVATARDQHWLALNPIDYA